MEVREMPQVTVETEDLVVWEEQAVRRSVILVLLVWEVAVVEVSTQVQDLAELEILE
jgi:hypothetical protein